MQRQRVVVLAFAVVIAGIAGCASPDKDDGSPGSPGGASDGDERVPQPEHPIPAACTDEPLPALQPAYSPGTLSNLTQVDRNLSRGEQKAVFQVVSGAMWTVGGSTYKMAEASLSVENTSQGKNWTFRLTGRIHNDTRGDTQLLKGSFRQGNATLASRRVGGTGFGGVAVPQHLLDSGFDILQNDTRWDELRNRTPDLSHGEWSYDWPGCLLLRLTGNGTQVLPWAYVDLVEGTVPDEAVCVEPREGPGCHRLI